jgi:phospholipid transport system substrate-binding protein
MLKILISMFIVFNLYANQLDTIKSDFTTTIDKVVKIVKNKSVPKDIRNDKIVSSITPLFDFKLMAKLSLGRVWRTMSKSQQKEFVKLYVNRMKKSYSSKVDKYTDEKIIINNIKQIKSTRVILNTSLVGKDSNLEVIYKYYKPKKQKPNKKRWLIYDVVISGVSIIKADRKQFSEVLQDSSIDELIKKLKK